ncbi:MAG: alpha/beta hydrolase [Gemmatimonadaceae bacterium]
MRSIFRLTLKLLKWGAICVVLVLVGIAVTARVLHRRDDARWHAPGRLVEVEPGRSMHIYCVGSGAPTVVLEAGLGDFGLSSWHSVLPQLSALSRTCAYDRAGTGWSDPPRVPPMPTPIVDDLHALLAKSGEPGPYLLVGHSLGGPLIRHYAVHYPNEVAGLVLVDGSHEDQLERMKGIPSWTQLLLKSLPTIHFLGIDRVAAQAQITDTMSAIVVARTTSDAAMHNTAVLSNALPAFFAEVKRDARPFGPLPLVALTAGRTSVPGVTPEVAEGIHREWVKMHKEIVARSTRGRWILAEKSAHYIQRDQPDLVVQSVREMLDTLRAAVPTAHRVSDAAERRAP